VAVKITHLSCPSEDSFAVFFNFVSQIVLTVQIVQFVDIIFVQKNKKICPKKLIQSVIF